MSITLAIGAVLLWWATPAPRLRRLTGSVAPSHRLQGPARLCAWLAALVLIPLPWSLPAGWVAASVLALALQRMKPQESADIAAVADVTVALDLMAACLRSGAAPALAAESVGRCLGGPTAAALGRAARALRGGVDATAAWSELMAAGGDSAAVARSALRRSLSSGAGLADALERAADQIRRTAAIDVQARLQSSTVRVVLPLALCFLPAFVLVGVVPIVSGIASGLF